jgi:hypothetical protein
MKKLQTWQWAGIGFLMMVAAVGSGVLLINFDIVDNDSLDEQYAYCNTLSTYTDRAECRNDAYNAVADSWRWWRNTGTFFLLGIGFTFIAGLLVMVINTQKLIQKRS